MPATALQYFGDCVKSSEMSHNIKCAAAHFSVASERALHAIYEGNLSHPVEISTGWRDCDTVTREGGTSNAPRPAPGLRACSSAAFRRFAIQASCLTRHLPRNDSMLGPMRRWLYLPCARTRGSSRRDAGCEVHHTGLHGTE